MIASLNGTLLEKNLDEAVIDVHGVGYRVFISLVAQSHLPSPGQPVFLRIRTVVREDALDLYGFLSATEETLFVQLTSVSQVGPKAAMNLLSGMEPEELARTIASGNAAALTKMKGVGKKTAERIILELKDKVAPLVQGKAGAAQGTLERAGTIRQSDLTSALIGMGYKPAQADRMAAAAEESLGQDAPLAALLKEALKQARRQ